MSGKHCVIGEFDSTQEDWRTYVERVNLYLIANDVTKAAKKKAILLSVCGAKNYHILRNLVAPRTPTELDRRNCDGDATTLQPEACGDCREVQIQLQISTHGRIISDLRGRIEAPSLTL